MHFPSCIIGPTVLYVGSGKETSRCVTAKSSASNAFRGTEMNDPYDNLGNLLTEMQHELWAREWPRDVYERIKMAADFRTKMFDAILDYRAEKVTP